MALLPVFDARTEEPTFLDRRGPALDPELSRAVEAILLDVRSRGDAALLDSARRYDAPELSEIAVTPEDLERAAVSPELDAALDLAIGRVRAFHTAQRERIFSGEWRVGGAGQRVRPLRNAGVYVPGGGASYPSSVYMNAVPALVASVRQVALCSPARRDGHWHPAVRVAMRKLGLTLGFKVGGAAAVAAMAFGTESVPRVDKVVGPGNRWVNEAKRQLWGTVGLDGYAGPSEVCVVADESANPAWAAADLLCQSEHAPDNMPFLVVWSDEVLNAVQAQITEQVSQAPRAEVLRQSLGNGRAVRAQDRQQALDLVNRIAPEHLTLAVKDPQEFAAGVENAGCILLGEHSPEAAGDYLAGPSHTLPTGGAARWQSPVSVLDFLKVQSVIALDAAELAPLLQPGQTLAEAEGFPAHAANFDVRTL